MSQENPLPPTPGYRWEVDLDDRRLIKHALALYSDVEAVRKQMIDVADRAMG